MFELTNKKVVIIGGTSGMGLATAKAAAAFGAEVIICSRTMDKLAKAKKEIGKEVATFQLDISQPEQIKAVFAKIGHFDHLLTPGSSVRMGNFTRMAAADEQSSFNSKFWGQYYAAKFAVPYLNSTGSIIFYAGCWSQRPLLGSAIPASINAAIEGLGRALAIELAPIRVNVISPGIIDTPIFSSMPEKEKEKFFKAAAESVPVGKIGKPEDIAKTAIYLMTNSYTTGSTIFVDGGSTLR